MPKRNGRGKPKGSSVQKKVKGSADSGLDFHDNPSNVLNVDPGFEEVQEAGTYGFTLSYPHVYLSAYFAFFDSCRDKHMLPVVSY